MPIGEHERQDEDDRQDPQEPPEVVHEPEEHGERSRAPPDHEPGEELSREEAARRHQRRVEEHQADHVRPIATDDQRTDHAEHRERHDEGHLLRERLAVHGHEDRAQHREGEEEGQHDPRPARRPHLGGCGRRAHPITTRNTSTGSSRPFTMRGPMGVAATSGAAATVEAAATISPASASDCSRWATFTASPTTVYSRRPPPPTVPAITDPVLTPMPTPSVGTSAPQPPTLSSA